MLDMDAGSRFLGECAIGTNYDITRYTRNTLFDEKIGGTVHFALGAGYPETGNTNQSGLHWDMVVDLRQGGYVEIDGDEGQRRTADSSILPFQPQRIAVTFHHRRGKQLSWQMPVHPLVSVIMGSKSDWETMQHASEMLANSTSRMNPRSSPPTARPRG